MTRGRKKSDIEKTRELVEGDLAMLGSMQVLEEMALERIELACKTRQTSPLSVCGEDLQRLGKLINRMQIRIKQRYEEETK
jgi:hypothetical protein